MSSVWIYYYCLFLVCCWCKALPKNKHVTTTVQRDNKPVKMILSNQLLIQSSTSSIADVAENIQKIRVKRDDSGGKFVEAAKIPQIKLFRLFFQMLKNTWDTAYVGGTHPLHPALPKVVVQLYKEKIIEFLMPDVGNDKV